MTQGYISSGVGKGTVQKASGSSNVYIGKTVAASEGDELVNIPTSLILSTFCKLAAYHDFKVSLMQFIPLNSKHGYSC